MSLAARFGRHVRRRRLVDEGERLLVAVSGGLDSVVLLHLLRFGADAPPADLVVAHLDHALRPSSRGDADWARGLARAWGLPFLEDRLETPPAGEAAARDARYGFLARARADAGADAVLTAHHADDQAETVLFRAVRGTGVRGLRGVGERGPGGVRRPLLPFWREELRAYAVAVGLTWREDPTNRDLGPARNVLRHRVLPLLEADVAPGARRALVRLGALAGRHERALAALAEEALGGLVEEADEDRIVLARPGFLAYDSVVREVLVRTVSRRLGADLDRAGTRAALEFISRGASGGGVELPRRVTLSREFDRIVLRRGLRAEVADRPLEIGDVTAGEGSPVVGGRKLHASWSATGRPDARWVEGFDRRSVVLPLTIRGRRPGDRIRLGHGTKKLKKVLGEARVPAGDRDRVPVLVDGRGAVLWVPGVVRSTDGVDDGSGEVLYIGITDADRD